MEIEGEEEAGEYGLVGGPIKRWERGRPVRGEEFPRMQRDQDLDHFHRVGGSSRREDEREGGGGEGR